MPRPSKIPWPLIMPLLVLCGTVAVLRLTHAEQGPSAPADRGERSHPTLTEGQQHLLQAVESSDWRTAAELLREGADPNLRRPILWPHNVKPDSDPKMRYVGDPLLKIATVAREESIVRLLLKHGAKVNAPGRFGYTPLMVAVTVNDPKLVQLLLENGADPNVMGATRNETPLHLTAFPPDNSGDFVLAPHHGMPAAELKQLKENMLAGKRKIRQRQLAIIRLLLTAGADPIRKDSHDMTPADYARQQKDTELTRLLSPPNFTGKAALPKSAGR